MARSTCSSAPRRPAVARATGSRRCLAAHGSPTSGCSSRWSSSSPTSFRCRTSSPSPATTDAAANMPWSPARRKYFARTHVEHDVPALPRAMEPFEAGAFVHLFRTDGHPVSPAREARLHAAIAVIVAWLPLVFLSPPPPEASTTERVAALLLDGTTSRYLVAIP